MEIIDRDTSWNFAANPTNTPWVPGYRFCVLQDSQKVNSKFCRHLMRHRRYRVYFEIDPDGHIRWTGGVKATAATTEGVERKYTAERPGSNSAPR